MRAIHITTIIAIAALIATIAIRESTAAADEQPRGQNIRIGTVDVYIVAERVMQQDELMREREEADERFMGRLEAIEDELRQMERELQALPQTDPRVQEILTRAQTLQTNYQSIQQERQLELEAINSRQLIDAFNQAQRAAREVADRRGYTHILSNRAFDREIETTTVGATLQEMLARPLIVGFAGDDLTEMVLTELDLPLEDPAEAGDAGIIPGQP